MAEFQCKQCGKSFSVSEQALQKYPGWSPKVCRPCKAQPAPKEPRKRAPTRSATAEEDLTVAEVLAKYADGPTDGVFTDGASHPNPGPGGWGAVFVRNGEIVAEAHGHSEDTTNNRMELTALIEGCRLVPAGQAATVWTDSQLCVSTINEWAAAWERNGWKRKGGAIKNLELVQELYKISKSRPELTLRWIKAHSGNRWNEYADALSTAYRREKK